MEAKTISLLLDCQATRQIRWHEKKVVPVNAKLGALVTIKILVAVVRRFDVQDSSNFHVVTIADGCVYRDRFGFGYVWDFVIDIRKASRNLKWSVPSIYDFSGCRWRFQ
ncbi:hypothetical protein OUZ56_018600 [Daphnia magna]|uniref:Uncharacterized protein n=1 Tax=Daphnia magna TaxID=35525 RepID=A0ABQ9Z9B8_9CRUS|nr:hypothetical protein OUZ56_018600 [Daphnia magna]